ncbi:hypothetical protein I5U23_04080 [Stenotrophomonas maltophilia]|uniref:Phosphoribosyltransferase domain-containing protein n=1 Tax=Stenotrophomonas riyadhensis TaxID=2859893 RepID=A0ABT2XBW6_9GAMM|nr:phosphoribosyltransferase family protein [Stenotrophomonas sp. CFS3442]MBH1617096.1 hypothetical protein [Stenotrophomonas maltophilia]MCV0323429.1 hypothetical protein [Stenotrophomonas sp. CFS3442]HEL4242865.1 hypothetical protein [Stenotrophomonas maltophilia]
MNYRSIDDLSLLISKNLHKIAQDTELVVAIPRSGMLVASIIALKLNLPLTDLATFVQNGGIVKGSSRSYKMNHLIRSGDARRILLVDDSTSSGAAIASAKAQLTKYIEDGGHVTTMAAYVEPKSRDLVDVYFEVVSQPRMFEWNIMHHPRLSEACLDIDGVLCVDPTQEENDDSLKYLEFIRSAKPLVIPTTAVKHLVTSRLEKYRAATEEWLERNGVKYGTLHMLDVATAEERRRLNLHAKFKASVYASDASATLFVESELHQAIDIANTAKKPVFCTTDNRMYMPGASLGRAKVATQQFVSRVNRKLRKVFLS